MNETLRALAVSKGCPEGTHKSAASQSVCKDCTLGRYMDETSSTASLCKACELGSFAGTKALSVCRACGAKHRDAQNFMSKMN